MLELLIGLVAIYLLFGNTIKGMFGEFRFKKKLNGGSMIITDLYQMPILKQALDHAG